MEKANLTPIILCWVFNVLVWICIAGGLDSLAITMCLAALFFLGMSIGSLFYDSYHRVKTRRGGE